MARYAGLVCYAEQVETSPGIWKNKELTRMMKGDLIRQNANINSDGKVNSDVTLNHRVSLIGDAYAFGNYFNMKWIFIDGRKVKINSVEVSRPRIILTLGGLWNGDED